MSLENAKKQKITTKDGKRWKYTSLHKAMYNNDHKEFCDMFYSGEFDIHYGDDNEGFTLLHRAASSDKHLPMLKILLSETNLDVNATTIGTYTDSPLRRAVKFCQPKSARLLVKHGAALPVWQLTTSDPELILWYTVIGDLEQVERLLIGSTKSPYHMSYKAGQAGWIHILQYLFQQQQQQQQQCHLFKPSSLNKSQALRGAFMGLKLRAVQWLVAVAKVPFPHIATSSLSEDHTLIIRWLLTRSKFFIPYYRDKDYADLFQLISNSGRLDLKGANVGDNCCALLSKAMHYKFFGVTGVDLSDNPKISHEGITEITHTVRNRKYSLPMCFTFSGLSPKQLKKFKKIRSRCDHFQVKCEFPTLLTIAKDYICNIVTQS